MKSQPIIAVVAVYAALVGFAGAQAAEFGKREPIEVMVQLGTKSGKLVIIPNEVKLETGKAYKLVVSNPSNTIHYFSVPGFNATVRSTKIDVRGGKVVRTGFQGPRRPASYRVREIEVRPGGIAEWTFVPLQAGSYPVVCGIPAYAKAGMAGHILVN